MKFILHNNPLTGKQTLYSFMSHVPSEVDKAECTEIDIPTDKDGMREAFQEALDTPTGIIIRQEQENTQEAPSRQPEPIERDEALTTREQFDAAWESFPMALKFHYAGLAFEDARLSLK